MEWKWCWKHQYYKLFKKIAVSKRPLSLSAYNMHRFALLIAIMLVCITFLCLFSQPRTLSHTFLWKTENNNENDDDEYHLVRCIQYCVCFVYIYIFFFVGRVSCSCYVCFVLLVSIFVSWDSIHQTFFCFVFTIFYFSKTCSPVRSMYKIMMLRSASHTILLLCNLYFYTICFVPFFSTSISPWAAAVVWWPLQRYDPASRKIRKKNFVPKQNTWDDWMTLM